MNTSIVGAGYLRLVAGDYLADMGHYVACMHVDPDKIEKLKVGILPTREPARALKLC